MARRFLRGIERGIGEGAVIPNFASLDKGQVITIALALFSVVALVILCWVSNGEAVLSRRK
jgi:hypothetical protein